MFMLAFRWFIHPAEERWKRRKESIPPEWGLRFFDRSLADDQLFPADDEDNKSRKCFTTHDAALRSLVETHQLAETSETHAIQREIYINYSACHWWRSGGVKPWVELAMPSTPLQSIGPTPPPDLGPILRDRNNTRTHNPFPLNEVIYNQKHGWACLRHHYIDFCFWWSLYETLADINCIERIHLFKHLAIHIYVDRWSWQSDDDD